MLRFARNDENSRIPEPCVIPRLDFFVIPRLDRGISSNRRHCERAISLLFTAAASQKHCASLRNSRIP
ncbi:hypothetical protein [Campylobacter sp.]|uniref:hypothetical protein n=1 Tax=Campylobacter sp. TaxID=205 RepID=UPI002A7EE0E8|nr:hypothetical protein [Campylobacter sp.]MDY4804098.1 hypothetical protein [Campylobacter sp.]